MIVSVRSDDMLCKQINNKKLGITTRMITNFNESYSIADIQGVGLLHTWLNLDWCMDK